MYPGFRVAAFSKDFQKITILRTIDARMGGGGWGAGIRSEKLSQKCYKIRKRGPS
jgi:hypothetical protein